MQAYLATRKREQEQDRMITPQQSSSIFDEAYIDGKLHPTQPSPKEIPLSYIKAFAAELVTAEDINRHEA